MNYALFGISYYKTVLLKNDTYKVVAAVFRDIKQKICELCAFRHFLLQNGTFQKWHLEGRSSFIYWYRTQNMRIMRFLYFLCFVLYISKYSSYDLLSVILEKYCKNIFVWISAEKPIVNVFSALYYEVKELRPSK